MKKIFLLDAMALIYRSHFAFSKSPRINSKGINTSAIFGFTNTLLELLNKEKPSHLAVVFDTPAPTFRHIEYPEYKAQRNAQPEDITLAIPYIKKLCKAMQIAVLELDGFEADDLIGTLAKKAEKADFQTFMYTPDKDYGQLVSENIFLYKPAFMGNDIEILGVQEILDKWEIKRVEQVIDMLGLQGDAVDNIPGITGIGQKTAAKLLAEFDTIENLLANVDKLKGKQQENIRNGAANGLLSKQLATIKIDVPIEFEEANLLLKEFDANMLKPLLDELEFRSIKAKLYSEKVESPKSTNPSVKVIVKPKKIVSTQKPQSQQQTDLFSIPQATNEPIIPIYANNLHTEIEVETETIDENTDENIDKELVENQADTYKKYDTSLKNYHIIDTPALRKSLVSFLEKQTAFCFDTETTSLIATEAEIVSISFSYFANEAYFVPMPESREEAAKILAEFTPIFEAENIGKIGQNIKYDMAVLQNYGVKVAGKLFDTMIAHYLLEPDMRHNMDVLSETYLRYSPIAIETLIGKKGKNQLTMRDVPMKKLFIYSAEDADVTFQLKEKLDAVLRTKPELEKLFYEVEIPLIEVLEDIERNGVHIDVKALQNYSTELEKDIKNLENTIYQQAGQLFNIASPKQLGEILFDKLQLDAKAKKTKTGQYATGEEVLQLLVEKHPIVANILEIRQLQKLKSTYIDALPELVSKLDNRVHTSYNQAVASTGRLSSNNPNLQNIPIKTEKGREIRRAFIPQDSNFVLLSADYSQIELRILADFSKDATMIDAFLQGRDIHTATASKIFGVPIDQVDSNMRRKAKTANFGIIYGVSAFGLSQQLNIPRSEAAELIKNYFAEFPTIKSYMDGCIEFARENEFVETILGRRRYLRDINSRNQVQRGYAERNAINAPIQGSAADIIKIAMLNIHNFLKINKLQSKMIMQVHDELVFEVHKDELEWIKTEIPKLMENAVLLKKVRLEVGMGIGTNWLEAH
jgi:DNA polymerase-1